jgi:uncharacterized protein
MDHIDPDALAGRRRDGFIELETTEDGMKVFGDFHPAIGEGAPLNPDYAENLLGSEGITYGVDLDRIKETVFACNTERKKVTGVVIARGKPPVNEVPGHYEIPPRLTGPRGKPAEEGARVNHRAVHPFVLVRKDEPIARWIEPSEGEEGMTVTGVSRPPEKSTVDAYEPGENTRLEEGTVRAEKPGLFSIENNRLTVKELLEIKGNVDYHTGHIIFPGDVLISGEIREGFKVFAGGSVYCNETVEATEIAANRDFIVKTGVIGRGPGKIRVGGEVQAKFLENCDIKNRGRLTVQGSMVNSTVKCMDRIVLGDHGKIVGGEVSAVHGISSGDIGNKAYVHTYVQCGVDFESQKGLDKTKRKHLSLYLKLQKIDEMYQSNPTRQLESLRERMREVMSGLVEKMNEFLEKINKDEDAIIEVRGTVYPGTTVDICHTDYFVQEAMNHIRFRLDKDAGLIRTEKL